MARLDSCIKLDNPILATNKDRLAIVDEMLQFVVNDSVGAFQRYGEEDWNAFISVASEELISPSIGWRIAESDRISCIPQPVIDYFRAFETLTAEKNKKGVFELIGIVEALSENEIKPIVLKGFAGFISGLYPGYGYRAQADIDLLVKPDQFVEAVRILKRIGYYSHSRQREDYFWSQRIDTLQEYPMMISDTAEFGIDLHRRTAIFMSAGEEFDRTIRENAIINSEFGVNVYTPDPASSLIHTVGHSHVQDLDSIVGRLGAKYLLDCIIMYQRLINGSGSNSSHFQDMLVTHNLLKDWYQLEKFVSAVNTKNSITDVATYRYRLGIRYPKSATRVSALLRLIRIAFRRPERYWTVEFYKNLLDKLKIRKISS